MGRKLDPDATRSDKLLKLYRLLLINDRKYSTSELTELLGCSKQTVRAIVDALNASPDIVINEEYDKNNRGKKYYLEHHKHGMAEPIALEGFRLLEMCRDLLGYILPEEDREQLNRAIFNASSYLPKLDRLNFNTLSIASSLPKGSINYSKFKEQLHALCTCINQSKCCILKYQRIIGSECTDYNFAPKHLLCLHNCFYIIGWITDKLSYSTNLYDKPATFLVHRILEVRILEDSDAADFPKVEAGQDYYGIIDDSHIYDITLKFSDPYAITYVADRQWSTDQKITFNPDGSMLLSFKSKSFVEVISLINSFGSQVEVISPEIIKEAVKDNILRLNRIYGITSTDAHHEQ